MIRVVIEFTLLFLLPSVLYVSYMYVVHRGAPGHDRVIEEAPFGWLAAAGAALVLLTLVVFSTFSDGEPGQGYEPPRLENGRIEPGRFN